MPIARENKDTPLCAIHAMGCYEVYRPYLLARDESGVQIGLLEGIDSGDFLRGQMS